MHGQLPPGPRAPVTLQTIGWWNRPTAYLDRCRERYGTPFTLRLLGMPPFVMFSQPEHLKALFTAPPEVLHPGEGAAILEPIVGTHSVILLDEREHLAQRRLLLPAFHGEAMQRLSGLMAELTEREVASWPRGESVALHPRLQRLTLEIVLRAVFGLTEGVQLDELRERLTAILSFGESPLSLLPFAQRTWFGRGRFARFLREREAADRIVFAAIEERRAGGGAGDDILALLLAARHEDGSPMSAQEVRDELMTALVAGHETTASQLAWAFHILAREPTVVERLAAEIDESDGDAYLNATINEVLRRKPVLPNAEPRLVKQPVEVGGRRYEPGVVLVANAHLLHHDSDVYPDPHAFRPERFLGNPPGTYTWIPFGGGRRRCLGAQFALLEMRLVLRSVLGRFTVEPAASTPVEPAVRRAITITPAAGARVVLRDRLGAPAGAEPREAVVAG